MIFIIYKTTNLVNGKKCIHCDGMFQPSHLVRWHNDNCKLNPVRL